jgi:hypothetical protein
VQRGIRSAGAGRQPTKGQCGPERRGSRSDIEVAQQRWSALHGSLSLELVGVRFDADPANSFTRLVDALLAWMPAASATA